MAGFLTVIWQLLLPINNNILISWRALSLKSESYLNALADETFSSLPLPQTFPVVGKCSWWSTWGLGNPEIWSGSIPSQTLVLLISCWSKNDVGNIQMALGRTKVPHPCMSPKDQGLILKSPNYSQAKNTMCGAKAFEITVPNNSSNISEYVSKEIFTSHKNTGTWMPNLDNR